MDLKRTCIIDIESNALLADMLTYKNFPYVLNEDAKLWCVVIRNIGTKTMVSAVGDAITKEWLQESLKDCDYLIAHNGIKFDFPVLKLLLLFSSFFYFLVNIPPSH